MSLASTIFDYDTRTDMLMSYDLILKHDDSHYAYANPEAKLPKLVTHFFSHRVVGTTEEQWEHLIGLVVCGLATRYQK